tara:strand:- start:38 stop:583 length:546 start_codon:yes stop_codon:yes gene_type:complete
MFSKEKVRKKFLLLRKKRYFSVEHSFFKPLIKIIDKEKKRKISLYYPSNYELDTSNLFKILANRKNLSTFLPKLLSDGTMKFVSWKFFDPLKVNSFGFLEPKINGKSVVPDMMIVPLLAFDKFHNRLGYGKGYYDKFLSRYISKKNMLTIGLAFSFQQYKKLPTSKLDVKLDYILTEKGIF